MRVNNQGLALGFIVVIMLLAFFVIRSKSASEVDGIKHVETRELKELLDEFGVEILLLDVREPYEFEAGHIKGSLNIPLGLLESKLNDLNRHKDSNMPIIVICRSGNRSLVAAELLIKNGFQKVYNYRGGILTWEDTIY